MDGESILKSSEIYWYQNRNRSGVISIDEGKNNIVTAGMAL